MQDITLKVLDNYTHELEQARKTGYDAHQNLSVYKEEKYDDSSYHIVAFINDSIVGTVRLTPYPLSPIKDWTNGKALLPFDEKTISVTKGFMLPEYRKNGIFCLIFSSAMLYCKSEGYNNIIGAYEHNVRSKQFTKRLGFEELDQLIDFEVPPYHKTLIIPIVCDLQKKYNCYLKEFEAAMVMVQKAGFHINFSGLPFIEGLGNLVHKSLKNSDWV